VFVNSADDPHNRAVTLSLRVRRGALRVTSSTPGPSPASVTRFRAEFDPHYEVLLEMLAETRGVLHSQGVSTEGLGWQEVPDSGILESVLEDRVIEAKERLQACLSSSSE
jgi:siroheme synthase (precorrin-2 oxidase/ferrochelatase)